LVKFFKYRKVR